jgi:hypothetical protein
MHWLFSRLSLLLEFPTSGALFHFLDCGLYGELGAIIEFTSISR